MELSRAGDHLETTVKSLSKDSTVSKILDAAFEAKMSMSRLPQRGRIA